MILIMLKLALLLLLSAHVLDAATRPRDNVSDLVTALPDQPYHDVSFPHYAGYITVDQQNGRALFYWFFQAQTQPDQKPLVLWLNGGPGCSSVGYGATQEIGPFIVDTTVNGNGTTLKFNPYSWNKEANIIFLESPIGVGFSYTNTSADYDKLGDDFTGKDAYAFLHNWFIMFPSYRTRTFFIAGESYAGKYVPELAEIIIDKNKDPALFINLQGILLGNPETNDADDWRGLVDYAWSHAVVSDETHKTIDKYCDFYSNDTWSNHNCTAAVDVLFAQYHEIDIYSLYTPVCLQNTTKTSGSKLSVSRNNLRSHYMNNQMGGYDPCLDNYAKSYYNRPDVQKALHVIADGSSVRDWQICNMTIFDRWLDTRASITPIYQKLIKAQLRIWVYSGDTDGRVPVLSTRYSLGTLGLPIKTSWRPWYHDKQVAGFVQEYDGLTFATFRGAGHAVPIFNPSGSLALFASFLAGEHLPLQR